MGEDELATIETLKKYRILISSLIEQFRGRVVDSPGDNVLAEFGSVVDAVECAVKIQEELKKENDEFPESRRMEFRIGVNLGDVVEDGERIYGEGVNIAARIEGLANGGGICISRNAYDQVKNKISVGYEYLGEHSVKNIKDPVGVYRLLIDTEAKGSVVYKHRRDDPRHRRRATLIALIILVVAVAAVSVWNFYFRQPSVEAADPEKMAYPLPEKPSIAVLPFDNLSGDPEQEYISDGISENIIATLSKVSQMFVIARNSTFTYKGKPIKVQQVAEELGVRYVLEGSVQKSDDQLRITAQLIDAIEGHHLWAERYDRKLKDIFAMQDEITKKIITALRVELTSGEDARLSAKGTENLEAYLKMMEAGKYVSSLSKDNLILARQLCKEAIALDPKYANAYIVMAWTHLHDVSSGWTKSKAKSLEAAQELAKKALTLDVSSSEAYVALSGIHLRKREIKEAIALREKAVALNPNSARTTALLAVAINLGGRHEEAIELFKKAIRLNPLPPNWYLHYLGAAYRSSGDYEKAIEAFRKVINRDPDFWLSHLGLAKTYCLLGREEEAQASVAELLRIRPKFSLAKVKQLPFKDKADEKRCLEVLRKAGLK
jgi:adenylate cyclase